MNDIEQKKIFAKNLNALLSQRNKTQKEVADAISVSPQTFNTWCQGIALPRMGKVQRLADYFKIEKTDLIDERGSSSRHISKGVKIPVLGRVAAGVPIEAIEDVIDEEEITQEMARTGNFFGLRIKGNSMAPDIHDGDTVIVKQQDDAENGEIVIVLVNGSDATCKRIRKYRDRIELIPNNPSYEPTEYTNQEIEELPVRVIGKVVELRRKF